MALNDEHQGEGGTLCSSLYILLQFYIDCKVFNLKVFRKISFVPRAGIEPTSKP